MKARLPSLIFWSVAFATATSIGLAAGPVVWRLSGHLDQPPARLATQQPQPETSRIDISPIIAFAPFGSMNVPQEAPILAGETNLGLTLLGVTIAEPVSASRAIIRGGDSKVQSYWIGADVTGTAQLVEINQGFVVLKVENRLETLSFLDPDTAASAPRGGPSLRNLIPRSSATAAPATSNEPDAVIARYRAAIHQNAQGVLDRLGLEQSERGYRISANASSGVRQAGFRPGDIVTVVNGQRVGDMEADRQFFDEIAASGRARVELERDGQVIIMTFPLQ